MSNPDVDPDLLAWIALSRVNDGDVVKLGDDYFDHGIRIPAYLAGPVAELAAQRVADESRHLNVSADASRGCQ